MKKKNYFTMAIVAAGVLAGSLNVVGCKNSKTPDTTVIDSSSDEEEKIPGRIYDDSEVFTSTDGVYTAKGAESYKIFNSVMNEGIIKAKIGSLTNQKIAGIIFNYSPTSHTYYRVVIDGNNEIVLQHFSGTAFSKVKTIKNNFTDLEFTLSIKIYAELSYIAVSVNDATEVLCDVKLSDESYTGFYSEAGGATFCDVTMNKNAYKDINDASAYSVAFGTANITNTKITPTSSAGLFINNKVTFSNGVLEYTFNANGLNAASTGIAFCIDNAGKETFWRDNGVTYYLMGVSITGALNLYKVQNGAITTLKYMITKFYDQTAEHVVRIVKSGDYFEFYMDGQYYMSYQDDNVLTGTKVGFCNMWNGGYFKNLKVNNMVIKKDQLNDITAYSGAFESCLGSVRATQDRSLCLAKTEMSSREGTITTNIGGANLLNDVINASSTMPVFGYGVVFNVTKPNGGFYDSEAGLSYYYFENEGRQYFRLKKIENGVITYTSPMKYVALSIEHGGNIKIVVDGNNIYCYYLDRLVIKYTDSNPLQGKGYGFRADHAGNEFNGGLHYSENKQIDKADYLIFGHSYTHLWLDYKKDFAELGDNVLDVGIGGARTTHYSDGYIKEMAAYDMEWAIYWNGINDINAGIDTATMANSVEALMTGIKAINPNFKAVVIGVNLCTYATTLTKKAEVADANKKYKAVCDKYDYLEFIDVEKIFCNENGDPLAKYFIDNLHPTREAYQMVSTKVITAIKNHR